MCTEFGMLVVSGNRLNLISKQFLRGDRGVILKCVCLSGKAKTNTRPSARPSGMHFHFAITEYEQTNTQFDTV